MILLVTDDWCQKASFFLSELRHYPFIWEEKFQVIVTELIRAKGITLLINSGGQQQMLLHADQSFDITQEVIDAMNEKED